MQAPDQSASPTALDRVHAAVTTFSERLASALVNTTAALDAASITVLIRGLYDGMIVPLRTIDDEQHARAVTGVTHANEAGWAYNDRLVEVASKAKAAGLSDAVIMHLINHFAEFVPLPTSPDFGLVSLIDMVTRGLAYSEVGAGPLDSAPAQPHGDGVTNSSH